MFFDLFLSSSCVPAFLSDHGQLHLLPLVLDHIRLLHYHVLTLLIQICILQLHHRRELLVVVHLVQVHTIGKHFFDISNLDWVAWR